MTITTLPAQFESHTLDIIIIGNERWARGSQIGLALGFIFSQQSMNKLYSRNKAEFGDDDTMVVELQTQGGLQLTRLYSAKGIAKVAMFAATPKAAAFRDWAATMLTTAREEPPARPLEPLLLDTPADLRDEIIDLQRQMIADLRLRSAGGDRDIAKSRYPMQYWEPHETQYVIDNYGKIRARQMATALGRSIDSVHNKITILRKLGSIKPWKGYSHARAQ